MGKKLSSFPATRCRDNATLMRLVRGKGSETNRNTEARSQNADM